VMTDCQRRCFRNIITAPSKWF